jgi:hypothetical protein
MACVRVKDLKKLLESAKDDDVIVIRVFNEDNDIGSDAVFSSDIADSSTLTAERKFGYQTSDGDMDVCRIDLVLDLSNM